MREHPENQGVGLAEMTSLGILLLGGTVLAHLKKVGMLLDVVRL
jgi:hypothetical protein